MRDETGSAAMELALLTPILVVLMLFVVFVGRLVSARADVDAAARDGARAASIARSPAAATRDGREAVEATLAGEAVTCRALSVSIDTAAFRPGGSIVATVTCAVDVGDLSGLGLPGTRAVSATFSEPVDLFRGVSP
jgi:Flp pilus assembly protein TadG